MYVLKFYSASIFLQSFVSKKPLLKAYPFESWYAFNRVKQKYFTTL
jgi:hypothetical protein